MKIYFAGPVPKGDKEAQDYVDWRTQYAAFLTKKGYDVEVFDPNIFHSLEGDSRAVVGADCGQIQACDVVIVYGEERLGAGSAMEFVVAKYFKKPVIAVVPKDTHHRRSNVAFEGRVVADWIHPFVDTFSDIIVESPTDLHQALKKLQAIPVKDLSEIDAAMAYTQTILQSER